AHAVPGRTRGLGQCAGLLGRASAVPADVALRFGQQPGRPPGRAPGRPPRSGPVVGVHSAWIEELLAGGRDWIAGSNTTVADLAVYHALWFLTARSERLEHELKPYRCIARWMYRVA